MIQTARSRGDAGALLRRIERHVPLAPARVVLALVQGPKARVVHASWIDSPPETERAISTGRAEEGRPDRLRPLVTDGLEALTRGVADTHIVVMVRCRGGRLVWLPSDLAWLEAVGSAAEWSGLTVAECYCVTEHGWRTRGTPASGTEPALAA